MLIKKWDIIYIKEKLLIAKQDLFFINFQSWFKNKINRDENWDTKFDFEYI